MKSVFLMLAVLTLSNVLLQAQPGKEFVPEGNPKSADGYFKYQNFKDALAEYLVLKAKDSLNVEYTHRIGLCYLYTNIDKTKAIPYLEWVVKQEKFDQNAWYDLGRAYQYAYRFNDARTAFRKFASSEIKDNNPIPVERQLEICDQAEKLMKNPIDVSISNLGPTVNTPFPDYNPFIPKDESYLLFSSKRSGNMGGFIDYDGFLTADIYYSQRANAEWKKAKQLSSTINTYLVEEVAGLTPDGELLFLYFDNEYGIADIFMSEGKGRTFKRPEGMGANINQKSFEGGATMTMNKKVLIFSSNRAGSIGGMDLWMSQELPTGEWGVPVNLGPGINTQYDEDFPYIAPDGKTMYFASTGHENMGGYDIFKCTYNKAGNTFSKPVNIGYPINTPDENISISFTASGRHAYISAVLPGGQGQQDIYRVTFNSVKPKKCFISGIIMTQDSTPLYEKYKGMQIQLEEALAQLDSLKSMLGTEDTSSIEMTAPGLQAQIALLKKQTENLPQVVIRVKDSKSGKLQGLYRPNKNTGKYIVIVEPGDYEFTYECPGYTTLVKQYVFHDDESSINNENEHVILIPETK